MSELRAFELKPQYKEVELSGATISFGPSAQTLDIKKALDDGDGVIVVDNPWAAATLGVSDILQEAEVPEGATATPVSVELPSATAVEPAGYIPQLPPEVSPPAAPVPDSEAVAVHAPDPETEEEAAAQPDSQAQAQAAGDSADSGQQTQTARFGR